MLGSSEKGGNVTVLIIIIKILLPRYQYVVTTIVRTTKFSPKGMEGREMSEERVVTGGRLAVVGTFDIKFKIQKPVSTRICQQLKKKHYVESLMPQPPGRGRSSEGEASASLTPSSTL